MQLVYVNNVHICEDAVIKIKHTVGSTDEYHVIYPEFSLCWRRNFLQLGGCVYKLPKSHISIQSYLDINSEI
jgi:hypothetical protein